MSDTEWRPSAKQAEFLAAREDEVLFGGAAGGGKALDVATPIPTPDGWRAMGNLRAGDVVYADDGSQCRVTAAFDAFEGDAFRVTFDDGESLGACAAHKWGVYTPADLAALTKRTPEYRAARRAKRPSRGTHPRRCDAMRKRYADNGQSVMDVPALRVVTTTDLARGGRSVAIPVAGALVCADAVLPIDPYCFGYWLGDGDARRGYITTVDAPVIAEFRAAGYTVTQQRERSHWRVHGLTAQLRRLGVLRNKHIPAVYLRASAQQRLALLQGLMDSDGCANGSAEFCNTSADLVRNVHELIVSLGWRVHAREGRAKLYSKDCGPKWTLKWTPDACVFRLPRKATAQRMPTRRVTRMRYVRSVVDIGKRRMRCIAVDSPSHLYIAGSGMVPTHNSDALIVDALGLQHKALLWDRYRALLIRQTTPQLRELIDRTRAMYPLVYPGADYSEQAKEWRFPSGAKVIFGYAERDQDAHQYQGQEYQWIGVDELGHFRSPYVWDYLSSRLRSTNPDIPCYMRATCNPGPKWIRERWGFSAAGEPSRREIEVDGRIFTRRFIPSKIDDNAHLKDTGYKQRLMQLPPQERAALLEGRWDVVDVPGAIYGDQIKDARLANRIRSVPVQPEAPVNTAWDLGVGDATAIWLWQVIGSEIHCVGYFEDSGEGLPYYIEKLKEFKAVHRCTLGEHWAPPDIAVREFSSGLSRVETARQHGIEFRVLGKSGLEDGIHAARMLFPRVYFDEELCAAGIDALTHYRRDYNGRLGEFKPTPVHDWASHGADAFRYLALAQEKTGAKWQPIRYPKLAIV